MGSRILIPVLAVGVLGLAVGGYLIEQRGDGQSQANRGLEINVPPPPGPFGDWGRPDDRHFAAALALQTPYEALEDTSDLYVKYDFAGSALPTELAVQMRRNAEHDRPFFELLDFAFSAGPRALTYPEDQLRGLRRTVDTGPLHSAAYRLNEAATIAAIDGDNDRAMHYLRLWMPLAYAHTRNPSYLEFLYLNKHAFRFCNDLGLILNRTEFTPHQLREVLAWTQSFPLESHQLVCMRKAVEIARWRRDNEPLVNTYQLAESRRMQTLLREDEDPAIDKVDRRWLEGALARMVPDGLDKPELQADLHGYQAVLDTLERPSQRGRLDRLAQLNTADSQDKQAILHRNYVRSAFHARAAFAMLRAAVRCELYRLEHDRWPESADELSEALPLDPWADGPLRMWTTEHGVMVYTIGVNQIDDQGRGQSEYDPQQPGRQFDDHAIHLLNPAHRNRMPLPKD